MQSENPTRHPPGTLRRSALIGLAATVADLGMLALLVHGFGIAPGWANVPALSLGLVIQFVGNKFWAFKDGSMDRAALARQGSAFLAVEVIAFLLNAGFFHILAVAFAVPALVARVVASGLVYFGFSYRLWALIFRPPVVPNRSS
jgi:putative flippase GtrA